MVSDRQRVSELFLTTRDFFGGFIVASNPVVNCAGCGSDVQFAAVDVARCVGNEDPVYTDLKNSAKAVHCGCGIEVRLTWKSRRWITRRVAEHIAEVWAQA